MRKVGGIDLFADGAASRRLHPPYVELARSPIYGSARSLMNDIAARIGDPDGRFISNFQSDGFHSRLFELACGAYLEHAGMTLDRSNQQPDFLIAKQSMHAAVECVTANPSGSQGADISLRGMPQLSEAELFNKVNYDFPRRMLRILEKKIDKAYDALPQCRGKPLILMVGPFFEAGSGFYSDDALLHPLFGAPDGRDPFEPFFQRDHTRAVSAVLFCNQFTVSKFFRLSTDLSGIDWLRAEWGGVCYRAHRPDAPAGFSFELGTRTAPPETWAHGVTLFENPDAWHGLPKGFMPASSRVFVDDDGMVTREVGAFHPVTSYMHLHVADGVPERLWKSR